MQGIGIEFVESAFEHEDFRSEFCDGLVQTDYFSTVGILRPNQIVLQSKNGVALVLNGLIQGSAFQLDT